MTGMVIFLFLLFLLAFISYTAGVEFSRTKHQASTHDLGAWGRNAFDTLAQSEYESFRRAVATIQRMEREADEAMQHSDLAARLLPRLLDEHHVALQRAMQQIHALDRNGR